jgi:glutathione S-transferase
LRVINPRNKIPLWIEPKTHPEPQSEKQHDSYILTKYNIVCESLAIMFYLIKTNNILDQIDSEKYAKIFQLVFESDNLVNSLKQYNDCLYAESQDQFDIKQITNAIDEEINIWSTYLKGIKTFGNLVGQDVNMIDCAIYPSFA